MGRFSVALRRCEVPSGVTLGDYVFVNCGCRLFAGSAIGDFTLLGPDVHFNGADHRIDDVGIPLLFSGRPELPATRVGLDCWIGSRATVLAGRTIGDCAVVAAGAIVSKDVAPGSIVAGVRTVVVGTRFTERHIAEHLRRLDACGPSDVRRLAGPKAQ